MTNYLYNCRNLSYWVYLAFVHAFILQHKVGNNNIFHPVTRQLHQLFDNTYRHFLINYLRDNLSLNQIQYFFVILLPLFFDFGRFFILFLFFLFVFHFLFKLEKHFYYHLICNLSHDFFSILLVYLFTQLCR